MAQVMNAATDSLNKSPPASDVSAGAGDAAAVGDDDLPPPQPQTHISSRRREREFRDRRDDRDFDRPPNRRDYGDRNSPPPPQPRDRDYKRRRSPGSPPYRDRRYSPQHFKRSRRGSPRGGYGPDDRSDSDASLHLQFSLAFIFEFL